MESKTSHLSWLLLLIFITLLLNQTASQSQDNIRKTYIVYLGELPRLGDVSSITFLHTTLLRRVIGSNSVSKYLLHSYKRSFNGFVVKLTDEEMQKLAGLEGVVSVFPNEKRELHTTRSWDFMGFSEQVTRTTFESDIILGVMDTGIWPESESFNDTGYSPPPTKWKGTCQSPANFTCNNKIIGAQYYKSDGLFDPREIISPRDSKGHGTHTASTAAGNLVSKASLSGLGSGTARGGVPAARIAVYKVCWLDGCSDADILAAFDDAIADGVDIISISVGSSRFKHYFNDSIAIGSFHAMKSGILTSASAGNEGPKLATITNFSPWCLSVAASTIDRRFVTKVQLGNGLILQGISVNTFDIENVTYPIIYGGDAPNVKANFTRSSSRLCLKDSLDPTLVKDKIVLCDTLSNGKGQFDAGAIGTLMYNINKVRDNAISLPLPASYLDLNGGNNISVYINTTSNPTATIFKSNEINDTSSPFITIFSSRGPNPITRDILKPDLSAPGVEIVAAWSPIAPVSGVEGDNRVAQYNIISGTSMACPHATAAAAYVKSFHPTWSPAAIKSALMTTTKSMSSKMNPEAELAYGSGHIDPIRAVDPGLVYDATEIDYIKFLCGQGYSDRSLRLVTGDATSRCSATINESAWDLNYPSLALSASPSQPFRRVFNRVVTNVGSATSTYNATVSGAPAGVKIQVSPRVLAFTSVGEKLAFGVSVEGSLGRGMVSASLVWDNGVHQVRSPIVIFLVS